MSFRRSSRPFVLSFLVLSLFPAPALLADPPDTPASWQFPDRSSSVTPEMLEFPALDLERIAIEDEFDQAMGKPPRFAVPRTISRSPVRDGSWVDLPNGRSIWRLQVEAADAVSLNFGFRDVYMPEDARLYIYSRDAGMARRYDRYEVLGPYGQEINEAHREFWSPILTASAAVIELDVPTLQRDRVSLELVQVGQGYRAFGAAALSYLQPGVATGPGKTAECGGKAGAGGARSGSCNMDVACLAPGDPWNEPSRSVGGVSFGGSLFCTGSLLNNTNGDRRMLFATATHCGVNAGNAASLVVYWNYEWPTCRLPGDPGGTAVNPPDPSQTSSGSTFLAATVNPFGGGGCTNPGDCSDMTLLELDDPADPSLNLYWAGWDRRGQDVSCGPQLSNTSTENLCASIHHPSGDEKRITFVESDIQVGNIAAAQGVHWHPFWDPTPPVVSGIPGSPASIPPGVTEPGSSGSPLYNADQQFIGILSGGPAFCGATGSSLSDFYGQLAHAWDGLGSPSTRMRDHLDPIGSAPEFIAGLGLPEEIFADGFESPPSPM